MPTRAIPPRDKNTPNSPWHFYQEGYAKPIEGHSKENLLDNILAFRIANELPIGDPAQAYEDYARHRWPERYQSSDVASATEEPVDKPRTALDEIRLKDKLWGKQKAKLVAKDEAEARAAICAACPANVTVHEITICAPCVAQLNRDALILSGNRSANPELRYCDALQHDNRVAVWMPDEALDRSKKFIAAAPAPCWLRDKVV